MPTPPEHRHLNYGQRLPVAYVDPIQQFISTMASANFQITLANAQTIQVLAGIDNDSVTIGIEGRWRFITATVNRAHPGGAAGAYDVWVTAADNNYAAGTPETDLTDYSFALSILPGGSASPATGSGATAVARKVASLTWDGTQITDIRQSVGGTFPKHAAQHNPGGSDVLDYVSIASLILMWGTLAARPAAAAGNTNYYYFATDSNSGTLYRSTGLAWGQLTVGLTHGGTHNPGSADSLTWTLVFGRGTLAARPAPVAANAGVLYSTSDEGALYRSTGSAWEVVAGSMVGTLASRPAAAAGNVGLFHVATDVGGGHLTRSNGSGWVQVAADVSHGAAHLPGGLDALDWTQVNRAGTIAARPAPTGLAGVLYYATDQGVIYRSDGALWPYISGALRGTLAARPSPAASTIGLWYLATDVNGGTLYRYTGSAWEQVAKGITEAPAAHAAAHLSAGTDAIAWGTVLSKGTLAARPAPAAGNANYYYFANDDHGGTLYQSDGAAWTKLASPPDSIVTATTVAGLGTGVDGKQGLLKLGQRRINVTYDGTLGKWLSEPELVYQQGAGHNDQPGNGTRSETGGGYTAFWRDLDTAGLKPQFKIVGRINGANDGGTTVIRAAYTSSNESGLDSAVTAVTGSDSTSSVVGSERQVSGPWTDIPAGYAVADFLTPAHQIVKAAGGGGACYSTRVLVYIRWVG